MHARSILAAAALATSVLMQGCIQVHVRHRAADSAGPAERFIGAWRLDSTKISSAGGGTGSGRGAGGGTGGGLGMGPSPDVLVIRQGSNVMTVDQLRGQSNSRLTFALDGRRVTNTIGADDNAREGVYVSQWSGARLVTTITAPAAKGSKQTVTYHDVRYVDADGSLVVEISIPGRPNSRRVVYKKTS